MRRNSPAEADFVAFVDARRDRLRRLAYAVCGEWHEAEDLTQITLAKLYVAWPRVQRRGAEDAYARRTLMRTFLDERRRPRRRERPTDVVGELDAAYVDEHQVDVRGPLVAALQQLPAMQRSVVVLRHWVDLSVDATAAELGISAGTVKSHNARALARLGELLATEHRKNDSPENDGLEMRSIR